MANSTQPLTGLVVVELGTTLAKKIEPDAVDAPGRLVKGPAFGVQAGTAAGRSSPAGRTITIEPAPRTRAGAMRNFNCLRGGDDQVVHGSKAHS